MVRSSLENNFVTMYHGLSQIILILITLHETLAFTLKIFND